MLTNRVLSTVYLGLLLCGCTENVTAQSEVSVTAHPPPTADEPLNWMDGRMTLRAVNLQGYAVEIEDDIHASALLNLSTVSACLKPLISQLPQSCATVTLTRTSENPLHADGQHHPDQSSKLIMNGVSDPAVKGCLDGMRTAWQWAPGNGPRPPSYEFSLHIVLARTADALVSCPE